MAPRTDRATTATSDPALERVERWFVRRGVPHAIHDYQATTDVFTRMIPFLVLVLLSGSFATFGRRFNGWGQALVFAVALGLVLVASMGVNRLRGRRLFQVPDDVGVLELLLFLGTAPLLRLIFGEAADRFEDALVIVGINVGLMALGYAVTSYAILPMMRWGAHHMVHEVTGWATLLARTLPLLLLFATFLFMNAEMWQVAHGMTWPYYAIVLGVLVAAALGFLAMRLPTEMVSLQKFSTWKEVVKVANHCNAPVDGLVPHGEKPKTIPLDRGERVNLLLLMLTAKVVQMALVGLLIGAFYVGFGLLTVRQETLLQWTEITDSTFNPLARFSFIGSEVVITVELLRVSGFIAAISALQFAVSLLSDDAHRAEFNADLEEEIREVMAVRTLYLSHVSGPLEPTPVTITA